MSIGTDLDAKACNKSAGLAAEKFAVQSAQKLRRIRCFSRNRVEGPDRERASHCGSEPLAAHVSNLDYGGSVCLRKNLEEITAHLPGWKISCLNRVVWQKWKHTGTRCCWISRAEANSPAARASSRVTRVNRKNITAAIENKNTAVPRSTN